MFARDACSRHNRLHCVYLHGIPHSARTATPRHRTTEYLSSAWKCERYSISCQFFYSIRALILSLSCSISFSCRQPVTTLFHCRPDRRWMGRMVRSTWRIMFCVLNYAHKRWWWRWCGKPGLIMWIDLCIWNIIFLSTDCRRADDSTDNAHGLGLCVHLVSVCHERTSAKSGQRYGADNCNHDGMWMCCNLPCGIHLFRPNCATQSHILGTDFDNIYVRNQYYHARAFMSMWLITRGSCAWILHSPGHRATGLRETTHCVNKHTPISAVDHLDFYGLIFWQK